MEIWVRSQDKKWFGEVKGFAVSEVSYNSTTDFAICKDNLAGRELGRYSTKKRCMEIIDAIQESFEQAISKNEIGAIVPTEDWRGKRYEIEKYLENIVLFKMPKE